jgi:hypothetical protein
MKQPARPVGPEAAQRGYPAGKMREVLARIHQKQAGGPSRLLLVGFSATKTAPTQRNPVYIAGNFWRLTENSG